jgi:hypothetical protein
MKLAEAFQNSQIMHRSGAAQTVHFTRVCLACNQLLAEEFADLGPGEARYVKDETLYLEVSSPTIASNYRLALYDILESLRPRITHVPVQIHQLKVEIRI